MNPPKPLLLALLLTAVACQPAPEPPQPLRARASSHYLPFITDRPCLRRSDIAWLHHRRYDDMKKLCATRFYHWGWWQMLDPYLEAGGIPIVWDTSQVAYALAFLPFDYDEVILFANECDFKNQCNQPPKTIAALFHFLQANFPQAQIIGPQFSDHAVESGYVAQYVDAYRRLYGRDPDPYRWALHVYRTGAVDQFCDELARLDLDCSGLWITEYGTLSCRPAQMRRIMTEIFADPRIERRFVFTNRTNPADNYCALLLDGDVFSNVGRTYDDFMRSPGRAAITYQKEPRHDHP